MSLASFKYPQAIILRVSGKHAERYSNARLSNDLRQVTADQACEAACLTPQGRVLAYFVVLKIDADFLMYCTGGERDEVIRSFKQFIVADQLEVKDVSADYELLHVSEQGEFQHVPDKFLGVGTLDSGLLIKRPRIAASGFDLLLVAGKQVPDWITSHLISDEQFNYSRVLAGNLSYPEELDEDFMFAESELAHAISSKKGCYAGQEAIEMLAARGQPANRIIRIKSSTLVTFPKGSSIFLDSEKNQRIGSLLSNYNNSQTQTTVGFAKIRSKTAAFKVCYISDQQFELIE